MNKKTLILALLIFCFSVSTAAKSFDELIRLASEDTLPEVRTAAALALEPLLVDAEQSDDDLRQLALEGASAELRSASARALGARLAQAANDQNDLLDLIDSGEFSEVQNVAAEWLSQALLEDATLTLDELIETSLISNNPRLRSAAVPALTAAWVDGPISSEALLINALSGETVEFRAAAAQALLSRSRDSLIYSLDETTLLDLTKGNSMTIQGTMEGANPELRSAGTSLLQSHFREGEFDLDALQQLADDADLSPELRAAAGAVLAEKLLDVNLSLTELEALATGATPELRASAGAALVQAIVAALGRLEVTLDELAESVAAAQSPELAKARAEAVFVLLRSTLVTLEAQSDVEAIVNGQAVTLRGITVDGSLEAYRQVAGEFLTGIYTFFGFIDRFENSLGQLTAIAEDRSLTSEFRAAAARALMLVFMAEPQRNLQTLFTLEQFLDEADQLAAQNDIEGALETLNRFRNLLSAERDSIILSAEVAGDFTVRQLLNDEVNRSIANAEQSLKTGRLITFRSELSTVRRNFQSIETSVVDAPNLSADALLQIASNGMTIELRQAAGRALSERLSRDESDLEVLIELANDGSSIEARQATIPALAEIWSQNAGWERLYEQAVSGTTEEIRRAAADALLRTSVVSSFSTAQLQSFVNGGSVEVAPLVVGETSVELQLAAADVLGLLWSMIENPSLDELIRFAVDETHFALQVGAAKALSRRLIDSELSEGDLFDLASMHTLAFGHHASASPALSDALAKALANRFGERMK